MFAQTNPKQTALTTQRRNTILIMNWIKINYPEYTSLWCSNVFLSQCEHIYVLYMYYICTKKR